MANQYTHLTSLKHPRLDIPELSMLFLTAPPSPPPGCWCSGFPQSGASTVREEARGKVLILDASYPPLSSLWLSLANFTCISSHPRRHHPDSELLSPPSSAVTAASWLLPHICFLLLSDLLSCRKWELLKTHLCSYYFLAKCPSVELCCFKKKGRRRRGLWSPRASVSPSASSLPLALAAGTVLQLLTRTRTRPSASACVLLVPGWLFPIPYPCLLHQWLVCRGNLSEELLWMWKLSFSAVKNVFFLRKSRRSQSAHRRFFSTKFSTEICDSLSQRRERNAGRISCSKTRFC